MTFGLTQAYNYPCSCSSIHINFRGYFFSLFFCWLGWRNLGRGQSSFTHIHIHIYIARERKAKRVVRDPALYFCWMWAKIKYPDVYKIQLSNMFTYSRREYHLLDVVLRLCRLSWCMDVSLFSFTNFCEGCVCVILYMSICV